MSNLPSIELLESTHTFPGTYTFKAIGAVEDSFVERVLAAVREQLPGQAEPGYTTRVAAGGRHVAVTLEVSVNSAAQVHEVYDRILKVPGLVVLF